MVLVTRPEPGASATAARLVDAGFRPVMAPFLAVRAVRAALPPASRLQAVVVASGNAVTLPDAYHPLPLFAVGSATAERAREAGFTVTHSAEGNGDALAALAAGMLEPENGPLLLATGRGDGLRLAEALRQSGFTVHRRAVYATSGVTQFPDRAADAIRAGLHAVLFFSTATGRTFAKLLPYELRRFLSRTDAVVIGLSTADALRHLPWHSVRVAVQPTQDGVLAQL